jgi:uncharacterized protein YdeI (YjbR/CyaY-like superfamily)
MFSLSLISADFNVYCYDRRDGGMSPAEADNLRAVTPVFFASSEEMRAWLEAHHATAPELWVGLYKKGSGKTGITIQEAQDQGMCFGWVDSLSRRIDDDSYMLRFTPRRPRSNWAERSIERAEELRAHGQMHEAGIRAFERRR